jgi:hypothetical protein
MPSDINDADDLEAVRAHFGIEKPDLIGFSYLGKLVASSEPSFPRRSRPETRTRYPTRRKRKNSLIYMRLVSPGTIQKNIARWSGKSSS